MADDRFMYDAGDLSIVYGKPRAARNARSKPMSERNQMFINFDQWVCMASSWLTRHPQYDKTEFRAICFDSRGRICACGKDFMRARDENAFPVMWVWPDQVAEFLARSEVFFDEVVRVGPR
jgi:hypothetical protein